MLPFVVSLVAGGCSEERDARVWQPDDHQQPSGGVDEASQGEPAEPGGDTVARAAAALFRASCASCHGVNGRGGGPGLPAGTQVPDLTDAEVQGRSNAELARVVREGRGLMPGFGQQLNERGIEAIVGHVRTLRQ